MIEPDTQQVWGVRVSVHDVEPLVWRRIGISPTMTLAGVHRLIQSALTLPNAQMYRFENARDRVGVLGHDQLWRGEDAAMWDVTRMTLGELMAHGPCLYVYGELQCALVRDEMPDFMGVSEGEHDVRHDGVRWRAIATAFQRVGLPDMEEVLADTRECAGLGGVTVRHFLTAAPAVKEPPVASLELPPREHLIQHPPEVLDVEALRALVQADDETPRAWSSREALDAHVLACAQQSGKTHNLYTRQLVAGEIWRARARTEARAQAEPFASASQEGDADVASLDEGAMWWHEEVTWVFPVHPTLRQILRMLPVAWLDHVARSYAIDLAGNRRDREQELALAMCDMEEAFARATAWSDRRHALMAWSGEGDMLRDVSEVLSWCTPEELRELMHEGLLFLGRTREGGVSVVVPVEMVQVWRLAVI